LPAAINSGLTYESAPMSQNNLPHVENSPAAPQDQDNRLAHAWTAHLLALLDANLPEDTKKAVLKECSIIHYREAQMDALVAQYRGDLPGFIQVLSRNWQWKVTYDPHEGVISADENKPTCVCPLVRLSAAPVSAILCHCSEGFAERMFSAVVGRPVTAQVSRSVLRGDPTCVYRIQIPAQA